jgi:hypothetical protein
MAIEWLITNAGHVIRYRTQVELLNKDKHKLSQNYSHQNIHRLLLYSRFPVVRKSFWFQNAIDYLMQYKTTNRTYIFPKTIYRK